MTFEDRWEEVLFRATALNLTPQDRTFLIEWHRKYCLDKQKVKDTIDKYIPKCYMDSRHYHKKDSCNFCKLRKELFGDKK